MVLILKNIGGNLSAGPVDWAKLYTSSNYGHCRKMTALGPQVELAIGKTPEIVRYNGLYKGEP